MSQAADTATDRTHSTGVVFTLGPVLGVNVRTVSRLDHLAALIFASQDELYGPSTR